MNDPMVSATQIRSVLARAIPSLRKSVPGQALGTLADLCAVGLLGLSMWLIVRAGEQPPILYLNFAIVGVRALAIGRAAFRYAERLSSHDAALGQLATLRSETFDALVPRVPGALEGHRRGEVLAAFVDDVDQLQDAALRVRQPLIVSGIVISLSLVTIALFSLPAALVLLTVLLVSGAAAIWSSSRIAGSDDADLAVARGELVDALLDRFQAAEVLAAYGALGEWRTRIEAAERRLERVQRRRARSAGLTAALLSLGAGLASLGTLVVLMPGLGEGMHTPVFAALVVVPAAVFEVFAAVPAALTAHRVVASSAERVAAMTETPLPAEIPTEPHEVQMFPVEQSLTGALLELRDVSARHPGAPHDAIAQVTLSVRAGETVVVTGESGAGKSTLASVLVGFVGYRGSYRVRGIEARHLGPRELRRTVGLCEQAPHLFDADLRQNLKFAREGADDSELIAVLDRVGLAEWARARGGLDTRVGEHGALVSGGQAQRIALARVLLADFPVVVLDEPTAGVDRELAHELLRDLLGAVPKDRAVVLITHTELPSGIRAQHLSLPSEGAHGRASAARPDPVLPPAVHA